MPVGTVKWFNATKGFGFIVPDEAGPDIFVHIIQVQASGLYDLMADDRVEYELKPNRRDPSKVEATKLRVLEDAR